MHVSLVNFTVDGYIFKYQQQYQKSLFRTRVESKIPENYYTTKYFLFSPFVLNSKSKKYQYLRLTTASNLPLFQHCKPFKHHKPTNSNPNLDIIFRIPSIRKQTEKKKNIAKPSIKDTRVLVCRHAYIARIVAH